MEIIINRSPGGQPGNQNARTHGFYSKTLDADGQRDYEEAMSVRGLEEEIALMRTKIMGILRHDPNNTRLLMMALATLSRLLMTRRQIAKDDKEGLKEALSNVLTGLAIPLGIGAGKFFEK
jgi:hypothetical protein